MSKKLINKAKDEHKLTYLSPKEYGVLETTKDMINPFKYPELLKTAGKYYGKAIKSLIKKRKKKKTKTYNI